MNYITFRIIIFVVLVLITFIFFKIIKNGNIKKYYFITIIITFIFVYIYPIENKLFKFNSVDDAFNYYYFPSGTIRKKYEYDNYAYIVYDNYKTDVPGLTSFIKKNNNWHINNLLFKDNSKYIKDSDFIISVIELPEMNSAGIIMYYRIINTKNNGKITDSLSSNFDTFKNKNSDLDAKIVILNNSNIDSNYTIYFNGKEYKPFEK